MALENVEFVGVVSSNVSEIGYDINDLELYVRFNNGYLYVYQEVPPEVWDQIYMADSKGRFIHTNLKGFYPYARVQ